MKYFLLACEIILFAITHSYAQEKKNVWSNKDVNTCYLKVILKALPLGIGESSTDDGYRIKDSIAWAKENSKKRNQYDSVVYLYRFHRAYSWMLGLQFENTSSTATIYMPYAYSNSPDNFEDATLFFSLYKKIKGIYNKISFEKKDYHPNGLMWPEITLLPNEVDSLRGIGHVFFSYPEADTGEYIIRGFYRAKCGDKISVRQTNDIHVRVIN